MLDLHGCSKDLEREFWLIWDKLESSEKTQWQLNDLDEVHVFLYQHGVQKGYDNLEKKYISYLRVRARQYYLRGGEYSDLVSAALIGFWGAVKGFRPTSIRFTNFAMNCVQRSLYNAITTADRAKHHVLDWSCRFECAREGEEIFPSVGIHGKIDTGAPEKVELLNMVFNHFSEKEMEIFARYYDGDSYSIIARDLGCTSKFVDNALCRARRKAGLFLQ